MIATEIAPKSKLKIKFGGQRIEAVPDPRLSLVNASDCSENGSCGKKRAPLEVIANQRDKRQRLDRGMTQQCSAILKTLMSHRHSWGFKEPVDPVALKIPDYFSVISEPMDLGTIKSKLQKNQYTEIEEFAADIRLTFSNAMRYNPPGNVFHEMAKILNDIFEIKWKSLEGKCGRGRFMTVQGNLHTVRTVEVFDTRQNCPGTPPLCASALPKKSKMFEKQANQTSDVRSTAVLNKCTQNVSGKTSCKGVDSHGRSSVSVKPVLSVDTSKCVTLSSQTSTLSSQTKSTLSSQTSKSDQESDGAVSTLGNGNNCPSSRLSVSVDSESGEGLSTPVFDVQMSPKKALRAAMLKSRFADTILKAQHKRLLEHGDITDPVKLQQEKEKLERRQREEKARIEAQIIAAEAAERLRQESESRKQREKEREAARIALQEF